MKKWETLKPKKDASLEKRVVITGSSGGGKTTIISQYVQGFVTTTTPTKTEEMFERSVNVKIGKGTCKLHMQIFDTPSSMIR